MVLAGRFVCVPQILLLPMRIHALPESASMHSLEDAAGRAGERLCCGHRKPGMESNLQGVEGALLSWVRLCGCMLVCMSFGKTGHKLVFAPADNVDERKENKA